MSFYNPYSKHPDYGQGINDLVMQFVQMMMMKKYMGQGQGQGQGKPQLGQTPMPQQGQTAQAGAQNYAQQAPGIGNMPQQSGVDPQLLAMISQYLGRVI